MPWTEEEIFDDFATFREEAQRIAQVDEHPPIAWLFANSPPPGMSVPLGRETHGLIEAHPDSFETESEKQHFLMMLRAVADRLDVTAVGFIAEMWFLETDDPDEFEAAQDFREEHGTIRDHPRAMEVVSAMLSLRTGRNTLWRARIRPTETGMTRCVEEWEHITDTGAGAFFVFPPAGEEMARDEPE
jgi:hypothetical protein